MHAQQNGMKKHDEVRVCSLPKKKKKLLITLLHESNVVHEMDTGQNGDKSKWQQPKQRQPTQRQTKTATIVVKTATTIGQNGDKYCQNGNENSNKPKR